MNEKEIMEVVSSLAKSQGYYGLVKKVLERKPKYLKEMAAKKFKDPVDLILYIETGM